jgi:glycine betaine/choline ABC-type transport system substrate-binding protein
MQDDNNKVISGRAAKILIVVYIAVLITLFLAEMNTPGFDKFRATDQKLILLALLILPFIIAGMGQMIRSLTLKFSGQELHVELKELKHDVGKEVGRVETNLAGQVSNAEQALWPMLAGYNPDIDKRLGGANKKVIIGSKLDTSQVFFAALLGQAVGGSSQNIQCELRVPNGGSMKNFADLKYRWIDMYIDYTGTCSQYFNIDHRGKTDEEIIKELNFYGANIGIKFLPPLGASEDYCLVMHQQKASELGVKTIRDLKTVAPQMTFTADPEFLNRKDCYLGLKKYGLDFKAVRPCKVIERYSLMNSGEADLFVGYETDPELKFGSVVRLKDPDEFFPRYMALPVVHLDALEKIPDLEKTLSKLANRMTTDDLIHVVAKLRKMPDTDFASKLAEKFVA